MADHHPYLSSLFFLSLSPEPSFSFPNLFHESIPGVNRDIHPLLDIVSKEARDCRIFSATATRSKPTCRQSAQIQRSSAATTSSTPSLQIVMARLKDEFRNILITHSSPINSQSMALNQTNLNCLPDFL